MIRVVMRYVDDVVNEDAVNWAVGNDGELDLTNDDADIIETIAPGQWVRVAAE